MDAETTHVHAAAASEQGKKGAHAPSIAEHPRAARYLRQARQFAGLLGFMLAAFASSATNTLAGTLLRALIAGVVCQVVVWAAAVILLRHLVIAELKSREHALMQAAAARTGAHGAQKRARGETAARERAHRGARA
jgi:pantoate kinase